MAAHLRTPSFFPRRELFRLMSAVMMLAVVGMLIYRTRDPAMWRWMADDDSDSSEHSVAVASKVDAERKDQPAPQTERLIRGPNELQPLQQQEAEYLFQTISDKEPLAAEEMASYWRLMRWSMTETFDDLWDRARKDRYFTHFAEEPAKLRGELVALKLSLRRSVRHDAPKNSLGLTEIFEASGVTDESRGNPYMVVFYDRPPEIPIRPNIHEEALFVGYFLKQWSYQDAMDVTRWAPLLIGRIKWRENTARTALIQQRTGNNLWMWAIIGGAMVVLGIAWFWTRPSALELAASQVAIEHAAIEKWLENGAPEGSPAADDSTDRLRSWEESADSFDEPRPDRLPTDLSR